MTVTKLQTNHRVEWFIDHDRIYGRGTCSAPMGATCRLLCDKGCPEWPCGHGDEALVDQGRCNAVEWWEADGGPESFYDGPVGESLRDGAVSVHWDGNAGWLWTWMKL